MRDKAVDEPRLAIGQVLALETDIPLGTAFAVSASQLLTDRHVLRAPGSEAGLWDVVRVRFPPGSAPGQDEVTVLARRVDDDEGIDVAVLAVEAILPAGWATRTPGEPSSTWGLSPLPGGLTPLVPSEPDAGATWRARGWSEMFRTEDIDGAWAGGSYQGQTREHGRFALQLHCDQSSASVPMSLHGFSGAPVLPASGRPDRFFGLIRWNPEDAAAPRIARGGTVYACPGTDVTARFPDVFAVENPYCGLRALADQRGDTFFGRQTHVEKLAMHLGRPGQRLTMVTGLPGSGKSSLVQAGLVARLRHEPIAAPGWTSARGWRVEVIEVYDDAFRARIASLLAGPVDPAQPTTLLILDQFERFVAEDPDAEITAQLVELIETVDGLSVLIVIRSDYLGVLEARQPEIHTLSDASVLWPGSYLSPDDVQEMIEGPAQVAAIRLQTGVADAILHDLAKLTRNRRNDRGRIAATTLPVLAIVLQRLGASAGASRLITWADYEALGGIEGTLTRWADHIFSTIPAVVRPRVDGLLLRLVRIGLVESQPDTRAVLQRSALVPHDDQELRRAYTDLLERQLVVEQAEDDDDPDPQVALVHDTLIRDWEHLSMLVDRARPALIWKATIFAAAYEVWRASADIPPAEREDALLTDRALDQADSWAQENSYLLDAGEQDFLDRSRACHRARRRARLRRRATLITVSVVLAASLITVTTLAVIQGRAASSGQRLSLSERLVTTAGNLRASDPLTADQLVLQAFQQYGSEHTRSSLLSAALEDAGRIRFPENLGQPVPTPQLDGVVVIGGAAAQFDRCLATIPVTTTPLDEPVPGSRLCLPHEYLGISNALSRHGSAVVNYGVGSRIHLWLNHTLRWSSGAPPSRLSSTTDFPDVAVADDGTVAQVLPRHLALFASGGRSPGGPSPQTIPIAASSPTVQISDDGRVVLVTDRGTKPPVVLLRVGQSGKYRPDRGLARIEADPVLSPDGNVIYSLRKSEFTTTLTRQIVRAQPGQGSFANRSLPEGVSGGAISPNGRMYVSYDDSTGFVRVDLRDPSDRLPTLPGGDVPSAFPLWINDDGDVSATTSSEALEVIKADLATIPAVTVPLDYDRDLPTEPGVSAAGAAPVITNSGRAFFSMGTQAYVLDSTGLHPMSSHSNLIAVGPGKNDLFQAVQSDGRVVSIDAGARSSTLARITSPTLPRAVTAGGTVAYPTGSGIAVQRLSDHGTTILPVSGTIGGLQLSDDARSLLVRVGPYTQVWTAAGDSWRRTWQGQTTSPSAVNSTWIGPPIPPMLSGDGRHLLVLSSAGLQVERLGGPAGPAFTAPYTAGNDVPAVSGDASRIALEGVALRANDRNAALIIDAIHAQPWLRVETPIPVDDRQSDESSPGSRALSPDGRFLLMVSSNSASIIRLDPGVWAKAMCATLGDDAELGAHELTQYAAGLDAKELTACPVSSPGP